MKGLTLPILFIIFIIISCKDCPDCPDKNNGVNHAPVIQQILINPPPPIRINYEVQLTAVAVDEDGDSLSYAWSATGGWFISFLINQNPTEWKINQLGDFTITCIVSDGKATDSKSIVITVTQ